MHERPCTRGKPSRHKIRFIETLKRSHKIFLATRRGFRGPERSLATLALRTVEEFQCTIDASSENKPVGLGSHSPPCQISGSFQSVRLGRYKQASAEL